MMRTSVSCGRSTGFGPFVVISTVASSILRAPEMPCM